MKPFRCLRAKSLLTVLILVLATFGTTLAWGKPKPFVPLPGSYSGTSTTLGQSFDTKGGVYLHKGKVSLVVSIRVLVSCTVEGTVSTVTVDQGFAVKPKGKTFGIKASGSNGSLAYYHYDLSGKFTSNSAFGGTLTVKGNAGSCSGMSRFSLKKG